VPLDIQTHTHSHTHTQTHTGITTQQLTSAARIACQALSRLTNLTELRMLGTQRYGFPWLLQRLCPMSVSQEVRDVQVQELQIRQ
jgi:hypothetical protein